eukprot:5636-Heterococcus_DN1.PRE.1
MSRSSSSLTLKAQHFTTNKACACAFAMPDNSFCMALASLHWQCYASAVDTKTKKLEAGPWRHSNVGKAATMLVPVPEPLKGVLVLGEQTVTYIDGIVVKATPIDQ